MFFVALDMDTFMEFILEICKCILRLCNDIVELPHPLRCTLSASVISHSKVQANILLLMQMWGIWKPHHVRIVFKNVQKTLLFINF